MRIIYLKESFHRLNSIYMHRYQPCIYIRAIAAETSLKQRQRKIFHNMSRKYTYMPSLKEGCSKS